MIHLKKTDDGSSVFDGSLSVESPNHQPMDSSAINRGFVVSLHPGIISEASVSVNGTTRSDIVPKYPDVLPEVVVVGYIQPAGGISFTDYLNLQAFLGISSGSVSPANPGGSGTGSATYSPAVQTPGYPGTGSNAIVVSYENSALKPGIDLAAYLKCFNTVPDADAQCSITIFTDLPVNNDPTKIFNWYSGATGHCFLQLTKTNGSQTITQVIGFTAVKPFAALTANDPVLSKIVDNAGHKFNACFTMPVTPSQLNAAIAEILLIGQDIQYSISKYNCVDFALQVINSIRGTNPLIIPKYQIPGQALSDSNTPEGLYKLLSAMEAGNGAEARNILTNVIMHAGNSHGPCN